MSANGKKRYLFDNPKNVKRVVRGLIAVCLVLFGMLTGAQALESHPWEGLFGFYAIYGFVACVLLVVLAKELRKLLMRDEDYYDKPTEAEQTAAKGDEHV